MGYTTTFNGSFAISPPLSLQDRTFLTKLCKTRRMKRNMGQEFGEEGEFYVNGKGLRGQDQESTIVDYNSPPRTQPSLWNGWIPNEDGTALAWDGREKFYSYTQWLEYLLEKILIPRGYTLNGEVTWEGEDSGDLGIITVKDNVVRSGPAKIVYPTF